MATPAQRTNTWTLDEWYDQSVAGTTGSYTGVPGLYIWGNNLHGQLGQNNLVKYSSPVQLPGTTWKEITLSGSYGNGLATKTDGTLWVWGHASYGGWLGLNQPNNTHISSPTQLPGTDWDVPRGGGGVAAIKTDNTLWVWGDNYAGRLGLNQQYHAPFYKYSSPVQLPGAWDEGFQKFSCGASTMGGVKADGKLWTWGRGDIGQLGINKNSSRSSPTQVGTSTDWDKVEMGFYFGLATKTDGTLWGFGMNGNGQLGQNTTQSPGNNGLSSPVQIPGTTWESVFASYGDGILATKTDGTLWSWGGGGADLGQNNNVSYSSPTQVGTDTGWRTDTRMGIVYNSVATKTSGALFAWGANNYGQLGINNKTAQSSPIQVPGTWSDGAVAGGYNADARVSAALKKS
mgnify:CR=1 FL=1